MSKEVEFQNRDTFIQLGIAISSLRKIRGLSQEALAAEAHISRSLLSVIEAPNIAHGFGLEVLINIARVLKVDPGDLLKTKIFPDDTINSQQ